MGSPKAPKPPDPNVEVNAQKSANQVNQVGPTGTVTYSEGPKVINGYDKNGNPTYGTSSTQTTQLSPEEQKKFDLTNQISEQLLTGANSNVGGLANNQFKFDDSGRPQGSFQFSGSGPKAAKDVYDRQVALLQPQFDRQNKDLDQKLANQGLPIGSEAYGEASTNQQKNQDFALTDAARAAESEGYNRYAQQSQQDIQQRQQQDSEANNADTRSLQQRQQQYNELASALGGDQIAPVGSFAGGGPTPTNVAGAYGAQNDATLAGYNANVASRNTNIGAGASLAAAAAIAF